MQIKDKTKSDPIILSLRGDPLGEKDAFMLRQRIYSLIESGDLHVILDMDGVKHINSAGLGGIISSMISLRKVGGDIRLARIGQHVQKVMSITHLSQVFQTHSTIEDAKQSFQHH